MPFQTSDLKQNPVWRYRIYKIAHLQKRGNKKSKCGYKLKQKTQPSFYLEMKFRKFYWSKYRCESCTLKKAECWRIDAFELWCWRRLLSLLDCKEIKPVNPKGNQPWIFIGRTDAGAEAPILWPPDAKSWLIRKDLDAGKGWRQEEKGMPEDEMVGWHHQFNGHELVQTPGKPGVLQSRVSQRVGHNWATEQQ